MKTLVWTPGTLAPSVIKGGKTSVSSILSVNSGGVLVKPGVLTPVPGAPYSVKSITGGLHIHPAFTFEAGVRYWITAGKSVTTDKDEAVYYMGEGVTGGMLSDPKPLQLSITTTPGNITPDDVVIVEYDYSAVWNVEVYYQINSENPVFYGTYEATGSVSVDTAGIEFEHNDQFTVIIKDLDSTLSDNITYNVFVKAIEDVVVGDLYLIGEFEDGVDYYALPNGDITTDITGIYLGVGNADGDIDLDRIEYEMTMTYPAGAEEIGLDIPFDVTATTNIQDGREVDIYAKKTGVSEHIGTATVSGGAISESVSIPSSAFTAEDTVTIELNYASGAVTDNNDVVCPNLLAITSYTLSIFSGNDIVIEGTFDDIEDITVTVKQGFITKSIVVPVVLGSWTATINVSILDGFEVNQRLDINAVSGVYTRTINNATYIKPTVTITTPLNNARVVTINEPIIVSGQSDGSFVDLTSLDKYGNLIFLASNVTVIDGIYFANIIYDSENFDESESYSLSARDTEYTLEPYTITLLGYVDYGITEPAQYQIFETDKEYPLSGFSGDVVAVYLKMSNGFLQIIGSVTPVDGVITGSLVIPSSIVGFGTTEVKGNSVGETQLRELQFWSGLSLIKVPVIVSAGSAYHIGTNTCEAEIYDPNKDGKVALMGSTEATAVKI